MKRTNYNTYRARLLKEAVQASRGDVTIRVTRKGKLAVYFEITSEEEKLITSF